MGPKRTFKTEEERAAYVLGYQDAINTARFTLGGAGKVVALAEGAPGKMVQAALDGVADALGAHAKEVT